MPTLDQMRFKATDDLARLTITDYDNLSEEDKADQRSIITRKLRSIYNVHKHINADLVCQHVLGKSTRGISQEEFKICCAASAVEEHTIEHERYH